MITLGRTLLDVILPAVCPSCTQRESTLLCNTCHENLQQIENPCPRCAAPCKEDHYCSICHNRGIPGISAVYVDYLYTGIARDLIIQAKVKSQRSAIHCLCALMPIQQIKKLQVDAVCVIPPSPGRRYGPHLASAVAKAVAREIHKPLLFGLKQTRLPAAQHELPAHMRKRNTEDLFIWQNSHKPPAQILLVDDLITSGHTISAAAHCLRKAGAKHIMASAIARTSFHTQKKLS